MYKSSFCHAEFIILNAKMMNSINTPVRISCQSHSYLLRVRTCNQKERERERDLSIAGMYTQTRQHRPNTYARARAADRSIRLLASMHLLRLLLGMHGGIIIRMRMRMRIRMALLDISPGPGHRTEIYQAPACIYKPDGISSRTCA